MPPRVRNAVCLAGLLLSILIGSAQAEAAAADQIAATASLVR
ncbi:MAG TPA: hypothetical protein VLM91_18745 [Candidatus Methylomirabilis sp.]|nr:hypothetical protein [Candidatus Methylomirabilis sp.]